jgi:hypothetical protein
MRLIDADALRRRKELRFGLMAAITTIQFLIDEAPTVEERKHGHWVRHNNIIACSECIWDMYWEEGNTELNYCPNCGAIMNGEPE